MVGGAGEGSIQEGEPVDIVVPGAVVISTICRSGNL